jgi:hypothetical protein
MGRGDYVIETNQKIRQRRHKARLKKKALAVRKARAMAKAAK